MRRAHALLPRAPGEAGPDEQTVLLMLWQRARRSILTSRQHLLNEAEHLLGELPLELREQLPDTKAVRPRLAALAQHRRRRRWAATTALRLRLLDGCQRRIARLDADERAVCRELAALVQASGSTLDQLCDLSTRSVAELNPFRPAPAPATHPRTRLPNRTRSRVVSRLALPVVSRRALAAVGSQRHVAAAGPAA